MSVDRPHLHPVIHRELGLNSNNLQGALPSVIGCLPALSRLRLNNNPGLTGPLPAAIGELAHLVYVGGTAPAHSLLYMEHFVLFCVQGWAWRLLGGRGHSGVG